MQHAHLTLGFLVVIAAATALAVLQMRSTDIRQQADTAVFLADDVGAAIADRAAPAAMVALHQKMLGAIDATAASPRVARTRARLEGLGLLAIGGDPEARAGYAAALREASRAIGEDASATGIRIQQTQMGIIAGAAIVLILLIRSVAAKQQASPRPRRTHSVQPITIDPLTRLGPIDAVRERLQELLDGAGPAAGFVGLVVVGIQPEHEHFLPLTRAQLDATLVETSRRLRAAVRATDVVARLARDELAVVMAPSPRVEDPGRVAGKLLGALDVPTEALGAVIRLNPRVGVAIAPLDAATPDGLIQRARLARRAAGASPAAIYRAYDEEVAAAEIGSVQLLADLSDALAADDGQLWVAYQPKIDLRDEIVAGFEALARWDHPRLGSISPARFVRAAEQSDLIFALGAWVFDEVVAQLAAWATSLEHVVPVSVNVSGRQLERGGLAALVADTLQRHGVPAELLELELTEGILLDDRPDLMATMEEVSRLGVKIAVDDFNTGHSAIRYLKRFPIEVLKIDRTFIRQMDDHRSDQATSTAIIDTAHSMSLRVVAEGVETPEQLDVLRTLGCDAAQGFYLAHPTSPDEIDRRAAR